jgi:hypothetical protein
MERQARELRTQDVNARTLLVALSQRRILAQDSPFDYCLNLPFDIETLERFLPFVDALPAHDSDLMTAGSANQGGTSRTH